MPILEKQYIVTTLGITDKDKLKADLSKEIPALSDHYDVVLHAAGKAHVYPKTDEDKKSFYDVNYYGTINLCRALESSQLPKSFVFISTVSVYGSAPGNMDDETRSLVGDSPYADSKIKAETYLTKWCKEHNVILGILRPGLLVGKGAPGNLGEMVRGIKSGAYLSVNHGKAKKSMLMVDDIANLVPLVAKKGGTYNVCDSQNPTFGELETLIAQQLKKKKPINVPYWFAKCLAIVGDILGDVFPINSSRLEKIVTSDTYSSEKAIKELGWKPLNVLENYKI